jgi:hypothetical protein
MTEITDSYMQTMLAGSRLYTLVLLTRGPAYGTPESQPMIWEHGRRNFHLRASGELALVGPLTDGGTYVGICVFTVGPDEARKLMETDPAIKAGILTFEVHTWKSFPGDALPV